MAGVAPLQCRTLLLQIMVEVGHASEGFRQGCSPEISRTRALSHAKLARTLFQPWPRPAMSQPSHSSGSLARRAAATRAPVVDDAPPEPKACREQFRYTKHALQYTHKNTQETQETQETKTPAQHPL